MTDLKLSITGMTCGHCVAAVSNSLKAIDGVEVNDVRIGSASVRFDESKVSPAQLAQAVAEEGYLATVGA